MNIKYITSYFLITCFALCIIFSCSQYHTETNKILQEPTTIEELGKLLFFDSLLSRNNTISCASCHKPQFAFADNVAFSFGIDSIQATRNTPSVMNQSSRNFYFWDGRAETIEEQAVVPIENPHEMDIPLSVIVRKLNNHKQYSTFFTKLFGHRADKESIIKAIVAYEKTLETSNSPFDNYMSGKDTAQFSEAAKRGQVIFNEKGKCFDCHFGPDFTNDDFKNIGFFNDKNLNDSGRFLITKKIEDIGQFKVPSLRNIALTKPYMHNGIFKTLKEVINYYNNPTAFISNSINRDTLINEPLHLTERDKNDLESFLKSLTSK